MLHSEKKALTTEQYKEYSIDSTWEAYELYYSKVIEERCDQFENEYRSEGYEIIFSDLEPVAVSIFDFKLIIARSR
jgi:hypothetical protein